MGILLVLASGMVAISGFGVSEARYTLERSQARAFADAILLRTVLALQDSRPAMRPRVDGVPTSLTLLGHDITLVVQDDFGRIDLNAAPPALLSGLFQSAGVSPAAGDALAAAIDIWRAGDSADNPLTRRRQFRRINEILRVPGMTPALFNAIAPALTVQTGRDQMDREVAPYEALLALPGMTAAQARDIVADRLTNTESAHALAALAAGRVKVGIDQRGWPFRLGCRFTFGRGVYQVDAVLRLTGTGFLVSEFAYAGAG